MIYKLKNVLVFLTYKTPITAFLLLSIFLIIIFSLSLHFNIGVYKPVDGTVLFDTNNCLLFEFRVNIDIRNNIKKGDKIIFYFEDSDKRDKCTITNVSEEQGEVLIKATPDLKYVSNDVYLKKKLIGEILVNKENIFSNVYKNLMKNFNQAEVD